LLVASGYSGTQRLAPAPLEPILAAGGLRSTLTDMTRWLVHQCSGSNRTGGDLATTCDTRLRARTRCIAADAVNPVLLTGFEWLDRPLAYGLGWFLGSGEGNEVVFHTGFIDGFSSALVVVPARQLGCVILTNANLSPLPGLLIRALLGARGVLSLSKKPILVPPVVPVPPPMRVVEVSGPTPRSIVGQYHNPAYGWVDVTQCEASLVLGYGRHAWPLDWTAADTAEVAIPAFGLTIRLPVRVEGADDRVHALSIPFSLDPRVPSLAFTRRPASQTGPRV
jgi:CubicO group peptidase (beta-lactamase class C family)